MILPGMGQSPSKPSASACSKLLKKYLKDVKETGNEAISFENREPEELARDDFVSLWVRPAILGDLEINILEEKYVSGLKWLATKGTAQEHMIGSAHFEFRSRGG
jgi:hypothetical protein